MGSNKENVWDMGMGSENRHRRAENGKVNWMGADTCTQAHTHDCLLLLFATILPYAVLFNFEAIVMSKRAFFFLFRFIFVRPIMLLGAWICTLFTGHKLGQW